MAIPVQCENPECGKRFRVKDEYAGKRIRCPACARVFVAPAGEPSAEEMSPPPKNRRRGKQSSRRFFLPHLIILGMPLPVFLGVVVVVGCLIGGAVFTVARARKKSVPKDWRKDYPTFLALIKKIEAARPKNGQRDLNGGIRFPRPDFTGVTNQPVEWEAVFLGANKPRGKSTIGIVRFDLETRYESTVDGISDLRGGAVYRIFFQCSEAVLPDWEAIPKGTKVRFAGQFRTGFITQVAGRVGIAFEVDFYYDVKPLHD